MPRTYKCLSHSHFVQLQELLHRQVSGFFLKRKKTTVRGVFFVFLPEKRRKESENGGEGSSAQRATRSRSPRRVPRLPPGLPGAQAEGSPATHRGSSSGSQPSSSLRQKKHCATSGLFSLGQCTKPAAAICRHRGGRQRPPAPAPVPAPASPSPRSPARACRRSPR